MLLGLLPIGAMAAAPYYEKVGALEAGGEYVLGVRDESTVRGGTLFTFTRDGTVEDSWSVKGGPGYLVATRSAMNCNSASVTAQASWTITMSDGAVQMQNNTSSKYYILFDGSAFAVNRTAGDPIALYDAEGNKLTALPESPFQAYICNADGTRFLSDAITADEAEKSIITDYVIADQLALEEFGLYGIHTRDVGNAGAWQFRDGKLYSGETGGLNAALDPANAPDAANYGGGKLQIGSGYLTVKDGALAIGTEDDAAAVQLWKKLDAPASKGTYLAITCDIHHKFRSDFAVDSESGEVIGTTESAERLDGWLTKASADFGGVSFDQLISCGDMGDANTAITGANYWDRVVVGMDTVANHEKVLGGGFFINGNHEWANGQYANLKDTNPVAKRVREAGYIEESDDYVIYSLSAAQTNNSFNAADITALDNYLQTAPNKPIFIVSHYPLHNFNRTEQRRDDLINVLNKYADKLQIIFLWGHNHTEEDPNYGIVFDGRNIDDSGMDIPHIEFTYCSAGCMTDDEYDVHAVFTKPKGMIAYIAPDKTVSLTYYDVNYDVMSTTVLPKPGAAEPEVDKTYLSELIERADSEAVKAAQDGFPSYKEEDYNALIKALTAAQAVQADEDADQASVDEAAAALENAYSDYMEIPFMYPTYFLEEAVAAAGKIDKSKYSEDSVKALEMAVASAEAVIAKAKDEDVVWSEIESAEKAIYDAIDALEKKPTFLFEDVKDPGKFYFDPVYWAFYAEPQITKGTDDTHFGPDNPCTRGHVVTFLWRAAGEPAPKSTQTPFTDLKPGAFYEKAVAWAVEEGITKGLSDTTFGPDATCTRGQIVTFLWRFKGEPAAKSTQTPFTDVNPNGFYLKAVAWAVENGITKGLSDTTFGPDATCTRGQVVTFLYRATNP
jgi:hypothetical protein